MSVIIIGGGGGHNAITRLVVVYPHATAQQKADIVNLLQTFTDNANLLAEEIEQNTPLPK